MSPWFWKFPIQDQRILDMTHQNFPNEAKRGKVCPWFIWVDRFPNNFMNKRWSISIQKLAPQYDVSKPKSFEFRTQSRDTLLILSLLTPRSCTSGGLINLELLSFSLISERRSSGVSLLMTKIARSLMVSPQVYLTR